MHFINKKKIIPINQKLLQVLKENKFKILALLCLFVGLEVIKGRPYINIIPNYQVLVIVSLITLLMILFSNAIKTKALVIIVLVLFCFALFTTLIKMDGISDMIGLIIFVLLIFLTIRQVLRDRVGLK